MKTPKPVAGTQWRANSRSSPMPPSFLKCSRCPKLFSFVISRCCVGCKARGLPRSFSTTVPDPIPDYRAAAARTREPACDAEALPFVRRGRRGLGWDCRHWGSWVAGRRHAWGNTAGGGGVKLRAKTARPAGRQMRWEHTLPARL